VLPLVAGFAYNPLFFSMAIDWCERMAEHQSDKRLKTTNLLFPKKPVPMKRKYLGTLNRLEAAGGEDVTPIGLYTINDDEQDIHGKLRIVERDDGDAEFIFRFTEYTEKPPYFIAIRPIGGKEIILNHIRANNSSKKELSITSGKVSLFNLKDKFEYERIPAGGTND
jgi:hypothetical protein